MEQKHTVEEMQDYITAEECLFAVMGRCNNIRNNSTNQQDIALISLYIKGLYRLLNSINIGNRQVNEVLLKYAPLVKNHKIDMAFIKEEYYRLQPFVTNVTFNAKGLPVSYINLMNPQHPAGLAV
jgi:hypothetical protein